MKKAATASKRRPSSDRRGERSCSAQSAAKETFQSTSIAPMAVAPDGSIFMNVDICRGRVPAAREVFVGVLLSEEEKLAVLQHAENACFEMGVKIARKL